MQVEVEGVEELWFSPGSPVRAASALARFGDGWLVVQDDATHAAWWRPDGIQPIRVAAPVEGLEIFGTAAGTKHLKPDFEAAVEVPAGVLLLGSGSTAARMRASLISLSPAGPVFVTADLTPVYHRVAGALGVGLDQLNLEGGCREGDRLRWFQRGNSAAGVPSAGVDVDLAGLLRMVTGKGGADEVAVGAARSYELGAVDGVALAITDAVPLPDGRVLVSAAAEDTDNAFDDGAVLGAALGLLDDHGTVAVGAIPGGPYKVEGLAVRLARPGELRLLAVVDADDPLRASTALDLRVRVPSPPARGGR